MRVRHKIPSIFSLSMVDVLCCALGCVILLWLLGAKQTDDEASERRQETEALRSEAEADRQKSRDLLERSRTEQDRLNARLKQVLVEREKAIALEARLAERIRDLEATRDTLKGDLGTQQKRAADLESRLKTSLARIGSLEADVKSGAARLQTERNRAGGLGRKLTEAETALRGLRTDLDAAREKHRTEQARADGLQKTIDEKKRELAALNRGIEDATAARKKLESTLTARDKELAAARGYKDRFEAAEERERFLAKQLKDRQAAMDEATSSLAKLTRQTAALKLAAESRFAGIELTGKRVIFLVDVSGSMEQLDENTPAPDKWREVCETVARIMRSLPELEKFQVITFAKQTAFPLGGSEKWLDYDPKASAAGARKTLLAVKPGGGTNMSTALRASFRYRERGLDTIYLLSDGLPNQGEGLTEKQRRELSEIDRGLMLGRHIRKMLKDDWNKAGKGRPRVKINTIGFFYESPDLGAFLWALARENDGSFVGMSKP
jgi:hypothetical protein